MYILSLPFYKRYVDDTLAAFQDQYQAESFLHYINQQHPNIKFTMEVENNNLINFLDVTVARSNDNFTTSFFRKKCFTDSLAPLMRSNVVYLYNCPKCNLGKYIGCTTRLQRVCICDHMGLNIALWTTYPHQKTLPYKTYCCLQIKALFL